MEGAWERQLEASMHEEYEWHCECDYLKSLGWTKVKIPFRPFSEMQEIGHWIRDNCKHQYEHKLNAGEFIFERERDAMMFKLAWMS
jgi:hypothetical protein